MTARQFAPQRTDGARCGANCRAVIDSQNSGQRRSGKRLESGATADLVTAHSRAVRHWENHLASSDSGIMALRRRHNRATGRPEPSLPAAKALLAVGYAALVIVLPRYASADR